MEMLWLHMQPPRVYPQGHHTVVIPLRVFWAAQNGLLPLTFSFLYLCLSSGCCKHVPQTGGLETSEFMCQFWGGKSRIGEAACPGSGRTLFWTADAQRARILARGTAGGNELSCDLHVGTNPIE